MTAFNVAKQAKIALENAVDVASFELKAFDKFGKTEMGLTPDHVKAMPEWKAAKEAFDKAFSELQKFNGWYSKAFKKEIALERKNKYKNA